MHLLCWILLCCCFVPCTTLRMHRRDMGRRPCCDQLERYAPSLLQSRSVGVSCIAISCNRRSQLTYRNARERDMPQVARLVSETFNGPYGLHQLFQKDKDYRSSLEQFNDRFDKFIMQRKRKHAMIVSVQDSPSLSDAISESTGSTSPSSDDASVQQQLCGFLELGILPSPVPVNVTLPVGLTILATTDQPYLGR